MPDRFSSFYDDAALEAAYYPNMRAYMEHWIAIATANKGVFNVFHWGDWGKGGGRAPARIPQLLPVVLPITHFPTALQTENFYPGEPYHLVYARISVYKNLLYLFQAPTRATTTTRPSTRSTSTLSPSAQPRRGLLASASPRTPRVTEASRLPQERSTTRAGTTLLRSATPPTVGTSRSSWPSTSACSPLAALRMPASGQTLCRTLVCEACGADRDSIIAPHCSPV